MRRTSRTRSTGEMISTFCFAGLALKFGFEALVWDGHLLGQIGLWASAAACGLAAIRFPLQSLWDRFRG